MIVDVRGLVEGDFLNLEEVFKSADWKTVRPIATFTACIFGPEGDEPGEVKVVLQSATEYGITAYRWVERDEAGNHGCGPVTLDRRQAVRDGEEYAEENDDKPDTDSLIKKIVGTGYFGNATADEIRAVCQTATEYSQGYLLLPAGEFVGYPIGRMWTTSGYLQSDNYVTLQADCPDISYAADALLRVIRDEVAVQ